MKKRMSTSVLSLLVVWLSVFGLGVELQAQTPTTPPAGMAFSTLSDAAPANTSFLVTNGGYSAALNSSWKVVTLTSSKETKWGTTFRDEFFQLSISTLTLGTRPYHSYLVSPVLDLAAVSGYKLSMLLAAGSAKGNSPFRIYIIDKDGNMLHELYNAAPDASQGINALNPFSLDLPAGMTGLGFIAFIGSGDKDNRVSLKMQDVKLEAASTEVTISAQPLAGLSYDVINTGEMSVRKEATVFISNFSGTPAVSLIGADATDFQFDVNNETLTATGGKIGVFFAPKSGGDKTAAIEVVAGEKKLEIPLVGKAVGGAITPEPTESTELLIDQFFYEFDQEGRPVRWTTKGDVTKLEANMGYNASTGFAVQIDTRSLPQGEKGYLEQTIDLNRSGFVVKAGDELEGMIHYRSEEPKNDHGALRFACKWLDKDGAVITTTEEKIFLDNTNIFFDRHKVWGEMKFRTVAPAGAERFVFAVEVNEGAIVRLDDFSLLRLIAKDRTPFVSVFPQWATIRGKVGEPTTGKLAVQAMHLTGAFPIELLGPEGELVLTEASLPAGNSAKELTYTLTPKKKGIFLPGKPGSYAIRFAGGAEPVTLAFTTEVVDGATPPTVSLVGSQSVSLMKSFPNETVEQELTFDVSGVVGSVNLTVQQEAGGAFRINTTQFYYSESQGKVLNNKVKLTFAPKAVGDYTATLILTSPMMEPVSYELKGQCVATGEGWTEEFKADRTMDPRFVGDVWKNYHLFDRGYYRLDGKWLAAGSISIAQAGTLECDESFDVGISRISISPASASLRAEISVDGGGHWQALPEATAAGIYTVDTHRPTRFRLVNTASTETSVAKIEVMKADPTARTTFDKIEDAMLVGADATPMALLNEKFETVRHTRGLNLPAWQNIVISGERPFYGWDQKNKVTTEIEEHCAQISFFKYQQTDDRPHEAWLISPTLSYKSAASKALTFRLRYELPVENGQEKFGAYIITEKDGKAQAQYLDITKLLLVEQVDDQVWYDYYVDLSKVEGITIDDLFHVAFSFYSPVGGSATSLTFMLDDITFGRTDITRVSTDKEHLTFNYIPDVNTQPQTLNVSVENPAAPIAVTLVPARYTENFALSANSLDAKGGPLAVGFYTKEKKTFAAALLLQARGGESKLVRLLAQNTISVEVPDAIRAVKVYPTLVTDVLYVDGVYAHYYLFAADGRLVSRGEYVATLDVSGLPSGHYLLQFVAADGGVSTRSFVRR